MGGETEPLLDGVPDTFGNESSFPGDDPEAAAIDHGTNLIDPVIRCTLDEGESQHSGARKATVRIPCATCSEVGDTLIPMCVSCRFGNCRFAYF